MQVTAAWNRRLCGWVVRLMQIQMAQEGAQRWDSSGIPVFWAVMMCVVVLLVVEVQTPALALLCWPASAAPALLALQLTNKHNTGDF